MEKIKAQTFGINGSKSLLKAMWEEMQKLGYTGNVGTRYNSLYPNKPTRSIETKEQFCNYLDYCPVPVDIEFTLPQDYDKALAFAKEQLDDKYWVKTTNEEIQFFLPDGHPEKIVVKPQFKIGQWLYSDKNGGETLLRFKSVDTYGRVNTDEYYTFLSVSYFDGKCDDYDEISNYKIATKEQIQDMLLKVAKQKGFINGCSFISIGDFEGHEQKDACISDAKYYPTRDSLDFPGEVYIYRKGKWATVVPSVTTLPFGNLEFTIDKQNKTATCKHGTITFKKVKQVYDWTQQRKNIQLLGYDLEILIGQGNYIKFGCCEGSEEELIAIYNALND